MSLNDTICLANDNGNSYKAFVVIQAGSQPDADSLIAFCKESLAHFKAPKYIEFVDMPQTATGKKVAFMVLHFELSNYYIRGL